MDDRSHEVADPADRWAAPIDACDDVFPPSDGHLRWQAEVEACAIERERELAAILRRVATRTHTQQDVQRLLRELDIEIALP